MGFSAEKVRIVQTHFHAIENFPLKKKNHEWGGRTRTAFVLNHGAIHGHHSPLASSLNLFSGDHARWSSLTFEKQASASHPNPYNF